jgi:hypothetical protein
MEAASVQVFMPLECYSLSKLNWSAVVVVIVAAAAVVYHILNVTTICAYVKNPLMDDLTYLLLKNK